MENCKKLADTDDTGELLEIVVTAENCTQAGKVYQGDCDRDENGNPVSADYWRVFGPATRTEIRKEAKKLLTHPSLYIRKVVRNTLDFLA